MEFIDKILTYSYEALQFEVSANVIGMSDFDRLFDDKWWSANDNGVMRFKWDSNNPIVFLPGKFGFFLQVNCGRHQTRRPPPNYSGTRQSFDQSLFNFSKTPISERLFRVTCLSRDLPVLNTATAQSNPRDCQTSAAIGAHSVTSQSRDGSADADWLLVNVSPISSSHVLLVPSIGRLLPQQLRPDALQTALDLLLLSHSWSLRAMFNSLGALASVNHQHLHLYRFAQHLFVETAQLEPTNSDHVYTLSSYPARAFVFLLRAKNHIGPTVRRVCTLADLILDLGLAFNLFITRGVADITDCSAPLPSSACASPLPCSHTQESHSCNEHTHNYTGVRVLVWPRNPEFPPVERRFYQVASCELAGHIAVDDAEALQCVTEAEIVGRLTAVTDAAFNSVKHALDNASIHQSLD